MKKFYLLISFLIIGLYTLNAQNDISVNIVATGGGTLGCDNPIVVNDNDVLLASILVQTSEVLGTVAVEHSWVICRNGIPVHTTTASFGPAGTRDLVFEFQPGNNDGDFPTNLESGLYEIKLRSCYRKINGVSQTVTTTTDGQCTNDTGDCTITLITGESICSEDQTITCLNYTNCPDGASIEFDSKSNRIEATLPSRFTSFSFFAENQFGEICSFNSLNVIPKQGCWTYKLRGQFPNGCEVGALFFAEKSKNAVSSSHLVVHWSTIYLYCLPHV